MIYSKELFGCVRQILFLFPKIFKTLEKYFFQIQIHLRQTKKQQVHVTTY